MTKPLLAYMNILINSLLAIARFLPCYGFVIMLPETDMDWTRN